MRFPPSSVRLTFGLIVILSAACGKKSSSSTSPSPASGGSGGTGGGTTASGGTSSGGTTALSACSAAVATTALTAATTTFSNTLSFTVSDTTFCAANMPCTSVTICEPGSTTSCQVIPNVLIDTGSSGLRLYAQALNATLCKALTPVADGSGNPIWEGVSFGGGTHTWGQILTANVQLGGEAPIPASVQVFSTAITPPTAYASPLSKPSQTSFNGILGVGLAAADCDAACEKTATGSYYYSCSGSTCTQSTLPVSQQVTNPASLLPSDNNGVIMQTLAVADTGTASGTGQLILGIGTQSNNTVSGNPLILPVADQNPFVFEISAFGQAYTTSYLDSGTTNISIPANSGLPVCTDNAGFYCPTGAPATVNASATSLVNGASGSFTFEIYNTDTVIAGMRAGTGAYDDYVVSSGTSTGLVLGMSFFFGKRIYIGFDTGTSSLGSGPLVAF